MSTSTRIRGVRTSIKAGSVVGRAPTAGGKGPAQEVPISVLAAAIAATGTVGIPGGASGNAGPSPAGSTHAVQANGGGGVFEAIGPLTNGQIIVGQTGAAALAKTMSGDAALSASGTLTIANQAVTYAKMQNETAHTLLGNPTGGAAAPSEITLGANLSFVGTTLVASSGGTTLNNAGTWNNTSGYNPGDCVVYNGAAYLNYVAVAAPAAGAAQWDPGDKVNGTISTTNTTNDTFTSTGAGHCCTLSNGQTSGKWYYEFVPSNLLDNNLAVGAATTGGADTGTFIGGSALGQFLDNFPGGSSGGSWAGLGATKRNGVCIDLTNKLFWITADVTAVPIVWNGSSSNTPATGTGGYALGTPATQVFQHVYVPTSATQKIVLYNGTGTTLIPAIPAGFSLWGSGATPNIPPDEDTAHWVGQGNSYPPGGRLSLTSGVAVQTADVVGGTHVYYVPYIHRGLGHLGFDLLAQLDLALDSNSGHTGYHQSGKNFDLFVTIKSGVVTLVTGPAWTNDTTRASAIDQTTIPGLWTNTASMTTKFDTSSSNYTMAAGTGLYVGTMRATANGQCTVQFNPAAASGGSNTIMGLFNAYNYLPYYGTSRDSTSSWSYASATYQNANASASNRISFIDGLGIISSHALYLANSGTLSSGATDQKTGVKFNASGAGAPDLIGDVKWDAGAGASYTSTTPFAVGKPTLGFNFWQAVEASVSTAGFFGNGFQMLMMAGLF